MLRGFRLKINFRVNVMKLARLGFIICDMISAETNEMFSFLVHIAGMFVNKTLLLFLALVNHHQIVMYFNTIE